MTKTGRRTSPFKEATITVELALKGLKRKTHLFKTCPLTFTAQESTLVVRI